MLKFTVEGFSKDSIEAALADALAKSEAYFSEEHDVTISILELAILPGRGYKAVLEVTVVPLTERDRLKPAARDVQEMRNHKYEYTHQRKEEKRRQHDMVLNHFARTMGTVSLDIPANFAGMMERAIMLNDTLEKGYFNKRKPVLNPLYEVPEKEDHVPDLKQVLGKAVGPDMEPD